MGKPGEDHHGNDMAQSAVGDWSTSDAGIVTEGSKGNIKRDRLARAMILHKQDENNRRSYSRIDLLERNPARSVSKTFPRKGPHGFNSDVREMGRGEIGMKNERKQTKRDFILSMHVLDHRITT